MKTIPLTRGAVAIVDDADYERLMQHRWFLGTDGYVGRSVYVRQPDGTRRMMREAMHRVVTNAPDGFDVDHVNHDRLDNRRANLRVCTRMQNRAHAFKSRSYRGAATSSRYKGVIFARDRGRWRARIRVNGRLLHLGHFADEADAARAYDAAARQHFGAFALTNFPARLAS